MRLFRYVLIAGLFVILAAAIYQTMLWLGVWGNPNVAQVKSLDHGDQEIALIEPATSGDDWGRMVAALQLLETDWPRINPSLPALRVNLDNAFPPLTADVPEVVFSFGVPKQSLRLRWYKISGEHEAASWVEKLQARTRQPLAIVGGGTSDRAVKLAYTLKKAYGEDPDQPSPVFLITTATSEKTTSGKSLIDVYRQRTFRFSFTNQKMVDSLLAFVHHRQYPAEDKAWAESLWVHQPATNGSADAPTMHGVTWEDERYSQDMNALFDEEFHQRFPKGEFIPPWSIKYSAGGFFHPTPQEQVVVGTFLALRTPVSPYSLLALPTQTVRMRRFLINLYQRSSKDARNLVVLNGDALSFHSVYRDRQVMWNILDLPYSVVFFSHRNPIDRAAGFSWKKDENAEAAGQGSSTGTHDLLLYRDLFEAFLYAAFDDGKLLGDPLAVRMRLAATAWHHAPADRVGADSPRVYNPLVQAIDPKPAPFFDASGNRRSHTGEHIVWVRPNFTEGRVDLVSKLSVWARQPDANGSVWQLLKGGSANVTYNQEEP